MVLGNARDENLIPDVYKECTKGGYRLITLVVCEFNKRSECLKFKQHVEMTWYFLELKPLSKDFKVLDRMICDMGGY